MAKPSKFTFIPVTQLNPGQLDGGSYCSYNVKTSMLTFSKKNPDIEKYTDAWVKLYVDKPKCTLAWKFLDRTPIENAGEYTKIKNVLAGNVSTVKVYIPKKISDALGVIQGMDYSQLKIEQYRDGLIEGVPPFHYVTFVAKEPKKKKV